MLSTEEYIIIILCHYQRLVTMGEDKDVVWLLNREICPQSDHHSDHW